MEKILIIKLGAKGDVVRTLPLLKEIKKKHPDSIITWITKKDSESIVKREPLIDNVLSIPTNLPEEFDIIYNFDIEEEATKLSNINAKQKYGFYNKEGFANAYNMAGEYYLNTLFDDDIKRTNKKTYQDMMFEIAELSNDKQPFILKLTKEEIDFKNKFKKVNNLSENSKIIGIHLGSSPRWPSKAWHMDNIKDFIKKSKKIGYEIIIFGGPNEIEKISNLYNDLKNQGIEILKNNPNNTDSEFIALLDICDYIICSDSFALHIAISLCKKTIALFFCTSFNEIEGYGFVKKIVSNKLYDFFPEKMDIYSEDLVKSISSDQVLNEILNFEKSELNVVNAIVKNKDKFLLIKRKEGLHKGFWAFPGGSIEKDETIDHALKRELKEETGLEMDNIIKKISEYSYSKEGSIIKGASFLINVKNYDAKPGNEVEAIQWLSFEEFLKIQYIPGMDDELLIALLD